MTENIPPCIICVAITGSVGQKSDNSALPIEINEQIHSTHEAFEAGASIAHLHVRKNDGSPCVDVDKYHKLQEGIKKHCPNMIIQMSTGGRSGAGKQRGQMLRLKPDMASLTTGSNNFPNRIYENHPDLIQWLALEMKKYNVMPEIECFDLSHIFNAAKMYENKIINFIPYIQFVFGVKNAMPINKDVFDFYINITKKLLPNSQWCAAGIGAAQITVNEWCIKMGGHCRTGLEDNIRINKNTLAKSNSELVQRTVLLCKKYNRPIATAQQAREILGL